jgi:hypothetical protein
VYVVVRGPGRTICDAGWFAKKAGKIPAVVPPLEVSLARQELGEWPFQDVTIYYPPELIRMVKTARAVRRDAFGSFESAMRAWRAVAGDRPLTLRFASPPVDELLTGKRFHGSRAEPEIIDRPNFGAHVFFLRAIGERILQDAESGRCDLTLNGFHVEAAGAADRR